jgi:tyrosine decarboxylase/aspartate 1-decarboxylase
LFADGLSEKKVLAELKRNRKLDRRYSNGKILCSMCTKPYPIAEKAYRLFLSSNLGDPGLFPGSAKIEAEVIDQLSTILHAQNGVGNVVSGGTEANLLALLAARNRSQISRPEVILPESAHFSFNKICNLLNLKPVYAVLDGSFRADASSVEKCLSKNTVAIVGTAGTSELGAVDPIDELSRVAFHRHVWLHVDAAFGGLVIPFLKSPKPKFDFVLEAVKSMTVDPHKMGMAAIPAGGIIFRDSEDLDLIKTETPYLTDQYQHTFAGTRTGAASASAWAVFKHLGQDGFEKVVSKCMHNTKFLADELAEAGFNLIVEPTLNIVAFQNDKGTKVLAKKLWKKGWFVSYVPRYDCIRIVVMPHVKKRHAEAFLKDLAAIEKL